MANHRTKQWVESILYGTGSQRRFTHDSPIQLDVWAQFFEKPEDRFELLVVPWQEIPPVKAAKGLSKSMSEGEFQESRVSYNRRVLAVKLSLAAIIDHVLPIMGWYTKLRSPQSGAAPEGAKTRAKRPRGEAAASPPLPDAVHLWDDIDCTNMTAAVIKLRDGVGLEYLYPFPQMLAFIRMAGLVFYRGHNPDGDDAALFDGLTSADEKAFMDARQELTRRILSGWAQMERSHLPVPGDVALVHSIARNRPARLALYESVRTVKGDAARSLFSIDCSGLTWAIMDSGIDAAHPAFQKDGKAVAANAPVEEKLKNSRVKETYDFAYLRDLLLDPKNDEIPPHVTESVNAAGERDGVLGDRRKRSELLRLISQGRAIDWDLLRPFLRVEHGPRYPRPIDTHGTHVAGIMGAKWQESGGDNPWMLGMCPDIRLIDIRVCRLDGTSDEFTIMSALQFIRHINASSDQIAVHGINMSLSLDHDAAVHACGRTPICEEAERTVANSVVVVVAAGNLGYRRILDDSELPFDQFCPVSITDPGNAEQVITVGATHRQSPHNYGVSYFSSRGPTGDGRIKPDLVAPGEKIYAPALGDSAVRLDGTSMAAPHVSGAAALLMARHIELIGEPARVKKILCSTATDLGRERYFQGAGLVDVLRAIQSI